MAQEATYHPCHNREVLSISIYYPDKHKTRALYVHLLTFLQNVSAVLFGHHQADTQAGIAIQEYSI
jgi:hypothetical protein